MWYEWVNLFVEGRAIRIFIILKDKASSRSPLEKVLRMVTAFLICG